MSEQNGSQTGTPTETQETAVADWRTALGLPSDITDDEADNGSEDAAEQVETGKEDPAAIQEQPKPDSKKLVVKFNKEDIEVDDEKVPELVQKGLALDKEREKRSEYEKNLDRVAKLQGYKDHSDLIANLDRIEQEREETQKRQFDDLQDKMITDLEYNGVSREDAIAYLQNNPVLQQAKKAMEESDQLRIQQEVAKKQQENNQKWAELYESFPDLLETAKAFNDGGKPDWYTPDMEQMVVQGYHPMHAYKLAHLDQIQTKTKKQTEQQIIKQQMLGTRAKVETLTPPDDSAEVPDSVKAAFAMFGLDQRKAAKHLKK